MQKENQHIEWKESWRDEYLKWISGFANAQGGTLIIGKKNDGIVTGLDDADRLLEEIPNKIRDILGILVDVDLQSEDGKECIAIHVDAYPHLVSYKGNYYYRSGSTKQELKGVALQKMILEKQGLKWDDIPVLPVSVKDLSREAFNIFRAKAVSSKRLEESVIHESDAHLLEKLRLTDGKYLRRSGVLLFHPDPEKYFTGAFMKIGFFRSNHDLAFHNIISGSLFHQVEQTLDLLFTKYLKAYISYDRFIRIETFPFPIEALRETIFNAVVHKDYSSGVPIQISVYDDKIMIWNCGQLPAGWTVDKLKQKHSSVPYNPGIATTFFRAGYIETWGRGIEKIQEECVKTGSPLPDFDVDLSGLMITFYANPDIIAGKVPVDRAEEKSVPYFTKKEQDILLQVNVDPYISKKALAANLNISQEEVLEAMMMLKQKQILKRILSSKGEYWEIDRDMV